MKYVIEMIMFEGPEGDIGEYRYYLGDTYLEIDLKNAMVFNTLGEAKKVALEEVRFEGNGCDAHVLSYDNSCKKGEFIESFEIWGQ